MCSCALSKNVSHAQTYGHEGGICHELSKFLETATSYILPCCGACIVVLVEWQCDSGFVKAMDSLSWLGRLDAMCMLWRGQHVQ